jgi:hypothetical protein
MRAIGVEVSRGAGESQEPRPLRKNPAYNGFRLARCVGAGHDFAIPIIGFSSHPS